MPTQMDFVRAKVQAYKHTLDGKTAKEKSGKVSVHVAEQFNLIVADIKKECPEAAPHLPRPITWSKGGGVTFLVTPVSFLELEMMLDQVLAVLDLLREQ